MEMELEGDLGIDSIKRVEILSAMQDEVPTLPEVDTSVMAELVTLGQIVDYMFSQINGGGTPPFDGGAIAPAAVTSAPLGRFRLRSIAADAIGAPLRGLRGSAIAVIDDYAGVAAALAELLVAAGVSATVVDAVDDSLDGVIFLGGLRRITTVDDALAVNREAFVAARSLATGAKAARLLVTVSDLGGDFGIGAPDNLHAWSAGLTGLIRTAAIEWPDAGVRAIDVERANRDAGALAAAIADELLAGGTELEVGLAADGTRTTLYSELTPVIPGAASLGASDVVVVSGGGRGVTAATMIELARSSGAAFALLGRSVLADEPPSGAAATDDAELKKILLAEATASGERITPQVLARRSGQILAAREVRQTLAAIEAAGGRARYVAVDITDHDAVAEALDSVRAELGPITAVVHGAGVLADKLIAEKSDAAFASVFDTKVLGLRVLLDTTRGRCVEGAVPVLVGRCTHGQPRPGRLRDGKRDPEQGRGRRARPPRIGLRREVFRMGPVGRRHGQPVAQGALRGDGHDPHPPRCGVAHAGRRTLEPTNRRGRTRPRGRRVARQHRDVVQRADAAVTSFPPIAIVGRSCLLPGSSSPDELVDRGRRGPRSRVSRAERSMGRCPSRTCCATAQPIVPTGRGPTAVATSRDSRRCSTRRVRHPR